MTTDLPTGQVPPASAHEGASRRPSSPGEDSQRIGQNGRTDQRRKWRHARRRAASLATGSAFLPVVAGVLSVVGLMPVLLRSFGFLDDYYVLYLKRTNPGPTVDAALVQGRPIAGILQAAGFAIVKDIDGLVLMRGFSVACLAAFAAVLVGGMVQAGWSRALSFAIAMVTLVLPSTAVMASWAILLMGPVALLLALLAALSAARGLDVLRELGVRRASTWRAFLPPFLLLTAAMLAYQPSAMAFWPVAVLVVLAPVRSAWTLRDRYLSAGAMLVVGAAASLAGYAAVKLGVAYVGGDAPRTALVSDVAGKLGYTSREALPRVFDPLSLTPRPAVAAATALITVALLAIASPGSLGRRVQVLCFWVAAAVLSYLPSLATAENWASARSLSAAFLVPLVGLAVGLQAVIERGEGLHPVLSRVGLVAVALVTAGSLAFSVQHLRDYWTGPQSDELAVAREHVGERLSGRRADHVVVLRSDYTQTLAPGFSYDEAGIPSSYAAWVPVPLTQLLVHERSARWLPSVTLLDREQVASLVPGTIVVDYGAVLDRTTGEPVSVIGDP